MANPVGTDVQTFLTGMGVTVPAEVDLDSLTTSAILEFESRTGRQKYQGDATTTAVRYTLPWPMGARVILPIADVWTLTEVRTGYKGAGTGTVLTEYTDYQTWPLNGNLSGRPVEAIEFVYTPSTWPGEILITGKLGYASAMPDDVFGAIVNNAAANALIQVAGPSGSAIEQKQGDRSIKYGDKEQATINRLMAEFDRVADRYMKVIG
jgi:hypothetical protein